MRGTPESLLRHQSIANAFKASVLNQCLVIYTVSCDVLDVKSSRWFPAVRRFTGILSLQANEFQECKPRQGASKKSKACTGWACESPNYEIPLWMGFPGKLIARDSSLHTLRCLVNKSITQVAFGVSSLFEATLSLPTIGPLPPVARLASFFALCQHSTLSPPRIWVHCATSRVHSQLTNALFFTSMQNI
jgi:hypothetical protein